MGNFQAESQQTQERKTANETDVKATEFEGQTLLEGSILYSVVNETDTDFLNSRAYSVNT